MSSEAKNSMKIFSHTAKQYLANRATWVVMCWLRPDSVFFRNYVVDIAQAKDNFE